MIKELFSDGRDLKCKKIEGELVVVGGGLSGVCTAITAARSGIKVILVQDRPVLGGNSSSEVRLWVLGATSHMGNNNRWAREGGVIDEILVENTFRNPEGNALIFDLVLLEKVKQEPKIQLLLNTSIYEVAKHDSNSIKGITGFCSQNSTKYIITAPLFCDASGDGILGFLSGAPFRMGAEGSEEFDEGFAPTKEYGELLGHSLYFYSKDIGKPVNYVAPSFALDDIEKIPRFKTFNTKEYGCNLWWIEYGGRKDTVHDTEEIKWELWKIVYGVWNYFKNSGKFPEAENLTLEWVGTIPGKRENRRFEGDYMINQKDIIEQRTHADAVGFGGWSIDLHPSDGVFSEKPGCNQWHSKGIYQIPYRCLYSNSINNLFLTGRLISATHVAFGSTRVMATSAYMGQATGMAASLAISKKILPKDIGLTENLLILQKKLMASGQHIPGLALKDELDLVQLADVSASTELVLTRLAESELWMRLDSSSAQLLPLQSGHIPAISAYISAECDTELRVELRTNSRRGNYTPDQTVESKFIPLTAGKHRVKLLFDYKLKENEYVFLCFMRNDSISLNCTNQRITGLLSVFNSVNKKVSNLGKQTPPANLGIDEFEFWCPKRRPEGHNFALEIQPGLNTFGAEQIKTGVYRPTTQPNAWVAQPDDLNPTLTLKWDSPQTISEIVILFDTDYDHPMESVLMGHPENVMPFCIRNYQVFDENGKLLFEKKDNYQTVNRIILTESVTVKSLNIKVEHPSPTTPAAIFGVRCYHHPTLSNL
jgi:hypothetical protein